MLQRDWQVILNGEGAEAELKGLDDLQGEDRQAHTRICFAAPGANVLARASISRKYCKTRAASSSEGKIRIESTAHACRC